VRITFTGHAGLLLDCPQGRIACDPWFNPAYFYSWFPFPANDGLDLTAFGRVDYLYVSHQHHDHFDAEFLRRHVSKSATVLLPTYPVNDLEQQLRAAGFGRFVRPRPGSWMDLGSGLRVMILPLVTPTDGPIGDSCLVVDDGATRVLNQNDARPASLELLNRFGPFDGHFLQFSGAIWYPMAYNFPPEVRAALGRAKRLNGMSRARRYARAVGAAYVFPCAGPPCFLDDDLFGLNDFDGDPSNVFPDQSVFLEYLREQGMSNGVLGLPGTTVELAGGRCHVEHALSPREAARIFTDKRAYLTEYQARWRQRIEQERDSWPRGLVAVLPALREWLEPLLRQADRLCAAVGGRVLLQAGEESVVIDFPNRRVGPSDGRPCRYVFRVPQPLVEACILNRCTDWVNELFLSCRFQAEREGPFNESVYTFFKSLSPERIRYVEQWLATDAEAGEFIRLGGYQVQRQCPHRQADLSRFGVVCDGILTCELHGWQFDLSTGRCLTSDDASIRATRDPRADEADGDS
jgi:UDP-MurNAc hydroxylase